MNRLLGRVILLIARPPSATVCAVVSRQANAISGEVTGSIKGHSEVFLLPGKGEVRLKVQAVGLNRAESMFICGQYVEPRSYLLELAMRRRGLWKRLARL
jgi:hypothetical protein